MRRMDLEIASEFVTMASYLVYLKTKMLLAIDEEEAGREMDELMRSLEERKRKEEYRKVKIAVAYLGERDDIGRNTYVRRPMLLPKMRRYDYTHPKDDILNAMLSVSGRSQRKLPPPIVSFTEIVKHEPFPVETKVGEIIKSVFKRGVERFSNFLSKVKSRSEVVAAFLAVLELLKNNKLTLEYENDDYILYPVQDEEKRNTEN